MGLAKGLIGECTAGKTINSATDLHKISVIHSLGEEIDGLIEFLPEKMYVRLNISSPGFH